MYLPQYHSIPENDAFWGKGFSDWVSVKKANPLYKGHLQPKIPLNNFYYDLSKKEDVAWQISIAKKYGIDALGIYHYWFNNEKNLLTKPAEILYENKNLDMDFFFAWDNASWKRSWSNVEGNDWSPLADSQLLKKGSATLIPYILGVEKDWENHFNYVLRYFKDERYVKKDNKPLFVIFNYGPEIEKMCFYWNVLAKKNGFSGMFFVFKYDKKTHIPNFVNTFNYQPLTAGWVHQFTLRRIIYKIRRILGIYKIERYDYDHVWKRIIKTAIKQNSINRFHGGFVSYDDSPRRGDKGKVVVGSSPQKFKNYLEKLLNISTQQKKEFVFITAWNEWGEGAYLEPDSICKYEYLEALKSAKEKSL